MNTIDVRNRESLIAVMSSGEACEYLFFWGHRIPKDGALTKSCLSQWYPARFECEGTVYPTAEHYMMGAKARLIQDGDIEREILRNPDPSAAKKLGRRVKNYDDKRWKEHRFEAVVQGNIAKFSQNRKLADFLKATGERILVEASPVDRIWGIGLAGDHPDAPCPELWPGLNLLGFALMDVRAILFQKNEQPS